jgi:hypothetical protein
MTVTVEVKVVTREGPDGEKPSCPADRVALSVRVPEAPGCSDRAVAVTPDGKPVRVMLMGVEPEPTVPIVTGTPVWPGKMVTLPGVAETLETAFSSGSEQLTRPREKRTIDKNGSARARFERRYPNIIVVILSLPERVCAKTGCCMRN